MANTPVGTSTVESSLASIEASIASMAASQVSLAAAPQVAFLDGVIAGAVQASHALVAGASREIATVGPITADGKMSFATLVPGTETTGSVFTTAATWLVHTALGSCALKFLTSYSGASGDYACARFRARSDAAGNVDSVNASASASINNHGNLCAVYAAGQPTTFTHNSAANIVCGMHSVIDATGASSGRRWSTWIDDHSETKAAAGHYLCRMSQNGTVAIDGCFTIYSGGRMPVLFAFEDVVAGGFLTDSGSPGTTAAGYIAVKTPAGTKYISLFTA